MTSDIFRNEGRSKPLVIGVLIVSVILCVGGLGYFYEREIRVVKTEFEDGDPKEIWIFKKKIIGRPDKIKEVIYFENGKKQTEIDYKNGKVNGWARMWHENGKLHVEATYKDSKTHGVRNAYHDNGQVFCRAEYENGKLLRKKNWDENGKEIYVPIDRD